MYSHLNFESLWLKIFPERASSCVCSSSLTLDCSSVDNQVTTVTKSFLTWAVGIWLLTCESSQTQTQQTHLVQSLEGMLHTHRSSLARGFCHVPSFGLAANFFLQTSHSTDFSSALVLHSICDIPEVVHSSAFVVDPELTGLFLRQTWCSSWEKLLLVIQVNVNTVGSRHEILFPPLVNTVLHSD